MHIKKQDFYDAKAKTYDIGDNEAIFRFKKAVEFAPLLKDDVVLDIGCKFGVLRDHIRKRQKRIIYHGIDISTEVIKRTENVGDDHFYVADITHGLPFDDKVFDMVFMLEVLEHVENPSLCLREIRRVLKPQGKLILSVPNPYCWEEIYGNICNKAENEGHIAGWTPQLMNTLSRFCGFKIKKRTGTFMRIPFSRRILRKSYMIVHTNFIFFARSFIYVLSRGAYDKPLEKL
jgi:SAM-dependent methyltransferase